MSLRWTDEQFEEWRLRKGAHTDSQSKNEARKKAEAIQNANLTPGPKPKRGMNGLETEFAQLLKYRKKAGEIVWYAYEPFRIRLADGTFYRPDFVAVDADGRTAIYECKGQMREAARVRLNVAVEKLPYPFFLVRKSKGELKVTQL